MTDAGPIGPALAARRRCLEGVGSAIRRESDVLVQRPELLWQQLHNRLRWEPALGPLVDAERARRAATRGEPWFGLRAPLRESSALVRTLTGHAPPVRAVVFSPDGRTIVAQDRMRVLLWERRTGVLRATLEGPDGITAFDMSASGDVIITAGGDGVVRTWDPDGRELGALQGHRGSAEGCAIRMDGRLAASTGRDGTLRLWDLAGGVPSSVVDLLADARPTALDDDPDDDGALARQRLGPCRFTPDGGAIVIVVAGQIAVWDVPAGRVRIVLAGHAGGIRGLAISPDGSFLVSDGEDGSVAIWDLRTGAERARLEAQRGFAGAVAVGARGHVVVHADPRSRVRVGTATGEERATGRRHGGAISACTVSPDEKLVVSASYDMTVRVSDADSGAELAVLLGHGGMATCCSVDAEGTSIASGDDQGVVKIWDLGATLREAADAANATVAERPTSAIAACAVSPDGTLAVTRVDDGTSTVWDVETGTPEETFRIERTVGGTVVSRFAEDGYSVLLDSATGPMSPAFVTWDVNVHEVVRRIDTDLPLGVLFCALSGDGSRLAAGGILAKGSFGIWDVATGQPCAVPTGHTDTVNDAAFSTDGSFVATASSDGTVRLWEAVSGSSRGVLCHHPGGVASCAVSPGGDVVASGGFDGTVRLWRVRDGTALGSFEAGRGTVRCAFSRDGTLVLAAAGAWDRHQHAWGSDNRLHAWEVATGVPRLALPHGDEIVGWATSADDARVVTVARDRMLRAWDLATGRELACLPLRGEPVCLDLDGVRGIALAGDTGGNVYLAELHGTPTRSCVVTATVRGDGIATRCPLCLSDLLVDPGVLGAEIDCPHAGCPGRLRVNPFVSRRLDEAAGSGVPPGRAEESPHRADEPPGAPAGASIPGAAPDATEPAPWINTPVKMSPSAVGAPVTDEAPPSPAPRPGSTSPTSGPAPDSPAGRRSIPDLLRQAGLGFAAVESGRWEVTSDATRLVMPTVRATRWGDLLLLIVSLPKPGMFGGDTARRRLLEVSLRADYVKAFVYPTGELVLASELPFALLTAARLRALVRGLSALGAVASRELADSEGWTRRLAACRLAHAEMEVDPAAALQAVRAVARRAGLAVGEIGPGVLEVELNLPGEAMPLRLVAVGSERVVSFVARLEGTRPLTRKGSALQRLLELNRRADVARLGIDADGNVALVYEVPEVEEDLLDRIREQFAGLAAGVASL